MVRGVGSLGGVVDFGERWVGLVFWDFFSFHILAYYYTGLLGKENPPRCHLIKAVSLAPDCLEIHSNFEFDGVPVQHVFLAVHCRSIKGPEQCQRQPKSTTYH